MWTFFRFYMSNSSWYTDTAQIFIGDDSIPGILYALLPEPRNDTNIMDTPFTVIHIPDGSKVNSIDYDPGNEMVYWNYVWGKKISRIQLDGTNPEVIVSTEGEWISLLCKCNFPFIF